MQHPNQANSTLNINNTDKKGNTLLHRAIEHGSNHGVRKLIREGANIEAKNNKRQTPLHLAILHHKPRFATIWSALLQSLYLKNDRADIVKFLVNEGNANVNAVDSQGDTPLILATKLAKPELVYFLLNDGKSDPRIKNRFEQNALHVAAEKGRSNIAKMLIDSNFDLLNTSDLWGHTPLHLAISESQFEIVKLFLESDHACVNTADNKNKLPLHYCANQTNSAITKLVLTKSKTAINKLSNEGFTPLHLAVLNNRLANAKLFIQDGGADVNILFPNGESLLHYALRNHQNTLTKLLINNNADVNEKNLDGNTPLHCALLELNFEMVEHLISEAALVNLQNNEGITPLHYAAKLGYDSAVDTLLKSSNIDPNLKDKRGENALFYAVKSHNIHAVTALLKNANLNLNSVNNHGETIMHIAIRFYHKEIFELLMNQNTIDFTMSDLHGVNPLALAASIRKSACIKSLLTMSAVRNAPNTPQILLSNNVLLLACQVGDFELVNRLLEFPNILDNVTMNNNEAFRIARANNYRQIIERLISIAAVRDFANAEDLQQINLHQIAADNENATIALDNQELGLLVNIKKYYGEKFRTLGQNTILANYQDFLKSQYDHTPAFDAKGNKLPLEPYNGAMEQKPYYKNIWHTGWRYFLRPNPWILKDMPFADILPNGRAAAIADEDKENLAYLWLAVSDDTIILENNISNQDLKECFTREIALIARAHNWDAKRRNHHGLLEEYDDEKEDKPTCAIGVSRRLIQSAFQHPLAQKPESRELTPSIFRRKFLEQLLSENPAIKNNLFYQFNNFSLEQLRGLKNALDLEIEECIPLSDEQNALFQISDDAVALFIEDAKFWFGSARITEQPLMWGQSYKNYEQFAVDLAKQCKKYCYSEIYDILNGIIKDRLNQPSTRAKLAL
ncbi:MAG TPA: ankyrin repeat domain-containing protein [Gammaproteobacteria bacterium]|nr:ankyrin repeat domain-containing protein [Gammaproteobacteria bacterium]